MAGILEDKIFDIVDTGKFTTSEVAERLKQAGYGRKLSTVGHHLRKMHSFRQLSREKRGKEYVYWNHRAYSE